MCVYRRMDELIHVGISAQKYLPRQITDFFTKKICTKIGKSRRLENKLRFAKTYKIKWQDAMKCKSTKSIESCVKKFDTLDDLFSRKISPELTKTDYRTKHYIVSPAECYARKVSSTTRFHIKGANYSLIDLIKKTQIPKKSTIFIFRLAPEHYHRIHSPTNSIIKIIREVGGTYMSVNPTLLNDIPVLERNYRKIIEFENGLIMVIVGATCIGSIDLSVKNGDKVVHGQDMGAFGFGGSCIALVVPNILERVNKKLSTNEIIFKPGEWVCKTRSSNNVG